jgi:hypothetical protein
MAGPNLSWRLLRPFSAPTVALASALVAPSALGQPAAATVVEVPLFAISKSENKNQVQFAVRVDDHCAPMPSAPVLAYWRMLEKGPARTEPLLAREEQAYGLASQLVTARGASGGEVRLVLRAVPGRTILVQTSPGRGSACQALSTVQIGGSPAHLYGVYARLKWPFGLDYLLLQGWSMDGTHVVTEKLMGGRESSSR